jgi:hypothetical protein
MGSETNHLKPFHRVQNGFNSVERYRMASGAEDGAGQTGFKTGVPSAFLASGWAGFASQKSLLFMG